MRAQGLPVNIIVLTALGLIVLVVVAAFFITGMSGAAQQTGIVEDFQAYCNGLCGQMVVAANNANDISALGFTQVAQLYQGSGCARQFGCCTVTLRTGEQVCAEGNCDEDSDCDPLCTEHSSVYNQLISDVPGNYFEGVYFFVYVGFEIYYPARYVCDLTQGSLTQNKCVFDTYLPATDPDCASYCSNCLIKTSEATITCQTSADTCTSTNINICSCR